MRQNPTHAAQSLICYDNNIPIPPKTALRNPYLDALRIAYMPVSVVCSQCSTEFEVPPNRKEKTDNLHCSVECYHERIGSRETFSCDHCGESFTTNKTHRKGEHTFCSQQCSAAFQSQGTIEVVCETCGSGVVKRSVKAERVDTHFCDWECYDTYHSAQTHVTVVCDHCGSDFPQGVGDARRNEHNFCDHSCYKDHISVSENHPAWKGGYGRQKNWRNQRDKAVERDGHQCQSCGVTEREHIRSHGFGLDAHHIIPRARFESLSAADDIGNLVTFCRSCHNRWEGLPVRPQLVN